MKKILFVLVGLILMLCVACSKTERELNIIAPNGAPGIALADLCYNENNYNIEVNKTADALKAAFATKEADIILAPVNLGATMYKSQPNYLLASVITWGNLYLASQKADFKLADLNGADVIFFGQGTINDAIVKYVLSSNDIVCNNISYLGSTQLTVQQLLADENAIVLVAEPALSQAKSQNSKINSISIQQLYEAASGSNSYPQAGCFVNIQTVEEDKKAIDNFLEDLENSCSLCATNTEQIAQYAEELGLGGSKQALITAIPNSNINYKKAKDVVADIEKVASLNLALFGGATPEQSFYYE